MTGEGDARQCEAWGHDAKAGEYCSMVVSIKTAKDMGWYGKKDSLWPKMPELMLKYRAAMWLIRTTAPDVLMGMVSKEEADDIGRGGTPPSSRSGTPSFCVVVLPVVAPTPRSRPFGP